MNQNTIKTITRAKGLNQSELARLAGVSRQAVSLWFKNIPDGLPVEIDLRSSHLSALARSLGLSRDLLCQDLPGLSIEQRQRLSTELLWDRSFKDLDAFLLALARKDERALARLVEKRGLFGAARIAGPAVWRRFSAYRKYLPAHKRKVLENVCKLQQKLGLI